MLDVVRALLVVVLYSEWLLGRCQASFLLVQVNKKFLTGLSLKSPPSRYDHFQ